MDSPFNINRRRFLQTAAASLALASCGAKGLDIIYKDKPWRVGLIGSGWYGKSDLCRLIQVAPVDVVALCDADSNMLKAAGTLISERQVSHKVPHLYTDYRKMLAEHEFDVILIGTPDHWHALQAIEAMKAGANLYLQKPVSVDVAEGNAIMAAAKKFNKTIQVGTQRRSTFHLENAKKNIIEKGLLGKISHVEMCCYYHMRMNKQLTVQPIPDHLDYEMWTGPAPMRAYTGLPHRSWRAFMEYGNGIVGDMCVHMLDTVRWILDLGWPKKISSTGGIYVQKDSIANTSDTQNAVFEFDELNAVWQHRSWGTSPDPEYPWAFFIYGEKGTLKASVHKYEFIPRGKGEKIMEDVKMEKELFPEDVTEAGMEIHVAPATRAHMLNLLQAIETKTKPVADIENGHISSASCIMANLAMASGKEVIYDPSQQKIINEPSLNEKMSRPYRSPWVHP